MFFSIFISTYDYYSYGTPWFGAAHGEEIQFVFGFPFIETLQSFPSKLTEAEHVLSVQVMKFWTNFAKYG